MRWLQAGIGRFYSCVFLAVFVALLAVLFYFTNIARNSSAFNEVLWMMGVAMPGFAAWVAGRLSVAKKRRRSRLLFLAYKERPESSLLGQFVYAVGLFSVALIISLVFPAVLIIFGSPALGQIAAAYLGLALIGLAFMFLGVLFAVSAGRFAWQLTLAVCLGLFVAPFFGQRFANFTRGIIYLEDVMFFVSLILIIMVIAMFSIQRRRENTPVLIILTVLVVVFNIFTAELGVRFDLSRGRLYSASRLYSVSDVGMFGDKEIKIYALIPATVGYSDAHLSVAKEVLLEYARKLNIELHFAGYSNWPSELEKMPQGSIVVTDGRRSKALLPHKIFPTSFNEELMQLEVSAVNIEAELMNALLYVAANKDAVVAHIRGNDEEEVPEAFLEAMLSANYEVVDVFGEIPEDADIVLVTTPAGDWGDEELGRLFKYLDAGGSAVFALDPPAFAYPRLAELLGLYGLELGGMFLAEEPGLYVGNDTNIFVSSEGGALVLIPNAQEIRVSEEASISGELRTSAAAFERPNPREGTAHESGERRVGVNIYLPGDKNARVSVLGSSLIMDESANAISGGANYEFLVDTFNWVLEDSGDGNLLAHNARILPKGLGNHLPLSMSTSQAVLVMFLLGAILPAALLAFGSLTTHL